MALTTHILDNFNNAKKSYDAGGNPLEIICNLGFMCYQELENKAEIFEQGNSESNKYYVFKANSSISRPFRKDLFVPSKDYREIWETIDNRIRSTDYRDSEGNQLYLDLNEQKMLEKIIYTNITCFSCVYDLWKTNSRKTPGTYFEVLVGSLVSSFYRNCSRTKFITIPNETEKVTTDIVMYSDTTKKGLVIPAKITTRERIVQPFAHQRILDTVFKDKYYSLLVCVSEMQRNKDDGVNQICVPGTIKLFHKYLAPLKGIVYLDPPARYLMSDVTDIVPISSFGSIFTPYIGELLR